MSKLLKRIKSNPMAYVFLLVVIFLLPVALGTPPQSTNKAIVTALAIDKIEEEYEISLLTLIPTPNNSFVENYKVISALGKSVAEAINKAGLHVGKNVALSHTSTIIINREIASDDIISMLDYLVRTASLAKNTMLLCCDVNAKELLIASHELDKNSGLKLEELIAYNEDYIYSTETSLETFYQGYYSPIKTSLIGFIGLEENPDEGVTVKPQTLETELGGSSGEEAGSKEGSLKGSDSSGSSDEGSTSGSSSEGGSSGQSSGGASGQSASGGGGSSSKSDESGKEKNHTITNEGRVAVFKDGKFLAMLEPDIVKGINWINPKSKHGTIRLENVTSQGLVDATLSYIIKNKFVRGKAKFVNGLPVVTYEIDVILNLEEVNHAKMDKDLQATQNFLNNTIKEALEKRIKTQFSKSLQVLRHYQADVIGAYDLFSSQEKDEFKHFLQGLRDPDDYLNYIVYQVSVKIAAA